MLLELKSHTFDFDTYPKGNPAGMFLVLTKFFDGYVFKHWMKPFEVGTESKRSTATL